MALYTTGEISPHNSTLTHNIDDNHDNHDSNSYNIKNHDDDNDHNLFFIFFLRGHRNELRNLIGS